MAVIQNQKEFIAEVIRVARSQGYDGYPGRERPPKILMSQRQYDLLDAWYQPYGEWMPDDQRAELKLKHLMGFPIVICPDCDLYIPEKTSEEILPRRAVEKTVGGHFS